MFWCFHQALNFLYCDKVITSHVLMFSSGPGFLVLWYSNNFTCSDVFIRPWTHLLWTTLVAPAKDHQHSSRQRLPMALIPSQDSRWMCGHQEWLCKWSWLVWLGLLLQVAVCCMVTASAHQHTPPAVVWLPRQSQTLWVLVLAVWSLHQHDIQSGFFHYFCQLHLWRGIGFICLWGVHMLHLCW